MPRLAATFSLFLLAATMACAQSKEEKSQETTKPIAALSWLVGGVWTADATKLGPGMLRIETRYQWSDNNAFLRFNTHFVSDKGAAHTYDGNFFWDPAKKSLWVWYLDPENAVTEGPVQIDGDKLQVTFRGLDFDGKIGDMRVIVTRKSNDDYRWTLQEQQAGEWKELAALEYLRVQGA